MTRAIGTAARIRTSASSIACGDVLARVRAADADLGRHQQLLRAQVQGLEVDDAGRRPASMASRILATSRAVADSPSSSDLVSTASTTAIATSSRPIMRGAERVPDAVAGEERQAHAEEREHQAQEGAEVLEQDHRELRLLGVADELDPALLAAEGVGFDDRGPEGEGLGDDGAHQHGQRHPPEVPFDAVRVLDFSPGLIQCEEAADAEEHDRDDEGVDVALAAVAEGVLGAGCPLGALAADQQQQLVAGVRERVDGLGQHGRGQRQQVGDELQDGDGQVCGQRRENRLGTAICSHVSFSFVGFLPGCARTPEEPSARKEYRTRFRAGADTAAGTTAAT